MSNGQINLIIDGLIAHLFRKEDQRLSKTDEDIVSRNEKASGSSGGFYYMGQSYGTSLKGLGYIGLHETLMGEMEAHALDRKAVLWDKQRIRQALLIALKDARTLQDVRDSLPNGIAEFIDQIKEMPRTRPEGFLLESNPRQKAQYFKLREKMEFYLAVRLLY